ncbi:MAG: LacI family DNA-binding transcriptional regulator [Acidobacteriota bacterium]
MRIKDIAELAGVSTATVSHVINNTRFVSEPVRQRVLAAIKQANYYPNAHARSLASGRSNTIGLIISDISNPFFPELVKSIEAFATERGYDVILANTNYDPKRTADCVRRMIERQVMGVAIMTAEMDFSLIRELAGKNVSVVFLDLGPVRERMSNINVNYQSGIEQAVRHLVDLGHHRIAFIGGTPALKSARTRRDAFLECMKRIDVFSGKPLIFEGNFTSESGRRAAAEILRERVLPTAIFAANDLMAIGCMSEVRSAGLRIPDDLSVVGFDDISFAALTDPPLTTIVLPRAELGSRAVEALLHTMSSKANEGIEFKIRTHLVVRQSTSVAPARSRRQKSRSEKVPSLTS